MSFSLLTNFTIHFLCQELVNNFFSDPVLEHLLTSLSPCYPTLLPLLTAVHNHITISVKHWYPKKELDIQ